MTQLAATNSGSGGGGGVLLVFLYVVQLGFGAFVYVKYPKRDDLPKSVHGMWLIAVWGGVVPCIGFALMAQLFYFATYRAAIGRIARHDRTQKEAAEARRREPGTTRRNPGSSNGNPLL